MFSEAFAIKFLTLLILFFIINANAMTLFMKNGTAAPIEIYSPSFENGFQTNEAILGLLAPIGLSADELQSCTEINPILAPLVFKISNIKKKN